MSRLLLALLFVLPFQACSGEKEPDVAVEGRGGATGGGDPPDARGADASGGDASAFAAGYDDSDCNLKTELVPGKPGSPGNLIPSERNPNGMSELAVMMRRFVDDLRDNKLLCEAGEPVKPMHEAHRMMRCAWPTVPDDRDEEYDLRAQTYLTAIRAFEEAPGKDSFNAIVNTCVACHQVTCGGVIDFIESLRWQ